MNPWESLIDRKIREAIEAGEFDNLDGAGQPLDLSENPYEDPDWRTAHRLLRNAGFAPSWIEERKDIDAELEARGLCSHARAWCFGMRAIPVMSHRRVAVGKRLRPVFGLRSQNSTVGLMP